MNLDNPDSSLASVVKGGFLILAGIGVGRALSYGAHILIARPLGPQSFGEISTGLALLTYGGTVGTFGSSIAISRIIPFLDARGERGRIKGTIIVVLVLAVLSGGTLAYLITWHRTFIAETIFNSPGLHEIVWWVGITVPFMILYRTSIGVVRGFKDMKTLAGIRDYVRWGVTFVLASVALITGTVLESADGFLLFAVGVATAGIVGFWISLRQTLSLDASFEFKGILGELATLSWPIFLSRVSNQLRFHWFVIALSIWSTQTVVGEFNVARTLALIIGMVTTALNIVCMPAISDAEGRGEYDERNRLLKATSLLAALIVVPFTTLLVIEPAAILQLAFGAQYSGAGHLLVVCAIGSMIASGSGPVKTYITAIGRPRLTAVVNISSLVVAVIATAIGIKYWGGLGAAFAMAIAMAVDSTMSWMIAYWLENVHYPSKAVATYALVLAAVALCVSYLGGDVPGSPWTDLFFTATFGVGVGLVVLTQLRNDTTVSFLVQEAQRLIAKYR